MSIHDNSLLNCVSLILLKHAMIRDCYAAVLYQEILVENEGLRKTLVEGYNTTTNSSCACLSRIDFRHQSNGLAEKNSLGICYPPGITCWSGLHSPYEKGFNTFL